MYQGDELVMSMASQVLHVVADAPGRQDCRRDRPSDFTPAANVPREAVKGRLEHPCGNPAFP
eukprot:1025143-Pyramimonas_sp.AAC.1